MKYILTYYTEKGKVTSMEVDNPSLELLQNEVGGYIQTCPFVGLREHGIEMLVDEEGLLKGKAPNMNLYPFFIVGNAVFVGVDGEELVGLTIHQVAIVKEWIDSLEVM